MSPSQTPKKSTSSVLDGNHSFPRFYACYLLRSRAIPNSNRTYVGSTPNPPKRIRQHNGELTQGAWTTSRFRPWEMQLIVHGFPSKLAALQFEWAWQKPELSRHLRVKDETVLFKKDAKRNWVQRKLLVMRVLISVPPFCRLPLHLRFFTEEVYNQYLETTTLSSFQLAHVTHRLEPIPPRTSVLLDLGGVLGKSGQRTSNTLGVMSPDGPIDIRDFDFRQGATVWSKWIKLPESTFCAICKRTLKVTNHLEIALCPAQNPCLCVTHLLCLANQQNILLPRIARCPICQEEAEWGQVVRSCYGRREGAEMAGSSAKQSRRSRTNTNDGPLVPDNPRRNVTLRETEANPRPQSPLFGDLSDGEEEWIGLEREMLSLK